MIEDWAEMRTTPVEVERVASPADLNLVDIAEKKIRAAFECGLEWYGFWIQGPLHAAIQDKSYWCDGSIREKYFDNGWKDGELLPVDQREAVEAFNYLTEIGRLLLIHRLHELPWGEEQQKEWQRIIDEWDDEEVREKKEATEWLERSTEEAEIKFKNFNAPEVFMYLRHHQTMLSVRPCDCPEFFCSCPCHSMLDEPRK